MLFPATEFCETQATVNPNDWHFARLSSIEEMPPVIDMIAEPMSSLGFTDRDVFGVRLALEEALVNALKHGNKSDPRKRVLVRYIVDRVRVLLEVEDQGLGFDPAQVPQSLTEENLRRATGRGILLMRSFTTWVRYNARGNCVTLCQCPTRA